MLTQARLKELVSYDPETGYFTNLINRGCAKAGARTELNTPDGYLIASVDGKTYRCHRLAWLYMTGEWPRGEIDHIDGRRWNNSFSNLRDVSKSGNMQNLKKAKKHNKLGILGVSIKKGRYIAQIQVNKKGIHLGSFDTAEQASAAYIKAKRELHIEHTI